MSDRKPLTFRERAAGTAIIFTALIGVTAVQHALSPAPIPTREPAAPIVLASHVADKVAVDVVEVERAMKQAGFRWEGEKGEEHDALMDTMAEMGMRHVTRALGDGQAMADIEWATTRAEREVAMGRWTVESFDPWANSVATLEADVRADLGRMQVEVFGARFEEKERAAEIWHDVALTVEERPEVYMDSVKAMQGTIGAAVWEFNNSLEVHLQSVVDGRSQILEVEQATQWADLMKDYTLDDLPL